jgi:hypothetical protein
MAICKWCKKEMTLAAGCTVRSVPFLDGVSRPRIKWLAPKEGVRCPDCGAQDQHYHHLPCDQEECPVCGGQLISCDCFDGPRRGSGR